MQCVTYANNYFGSSVRGNGADWYNSDDVKRLSGVESNCVACWKGGPGGYGHVGVVETYNEETGIMVYSDANYNMDGEIITRPDFTEEKMKKLFGSSFTFQGYVRPL